MVTDCVGLRFGITLLRARNVNQHVAMHLTYFKVAYFRVRKRLRVTKYDLQIKNKQNKNKK